MQRSLSQRAFCSQVPPGSPAPTSPDPVRVTLSQWMNRDNRQPNPSCVLQSPPHPHPRAGATPGPTRKRTDDMSATEGSHLLGGTVSTSHPFPLTRAQADASLPGRRARPSPADRLATCSDARAPARSQGWAVTVRPPTRGVGERERAGGPSRSSLHSARASSLTLPR